MTPIKNKNQLSIESDRSVSAALDKNQKGYDVNSKWDPQHYKSLTTLGKGNYATVYLVESLHTKQLYAMKVRSKWFAQAAAESISTEKSLLLLAKREKHPFVVEVFGGFQTQSHFILYLEFCQGGDLLHHLMASGRFNLERVRFYAAQVCIALEWFHAMNLLYRNLNLDNILLGVDGHIKLVDFVVSRLDITSECKTKSFCGTLEFMPPEMLLDRPYNSSIDWWQLGIITYQMLTQLSPFRGDDEDEIYDSILAVEPSFPDYMTSWTTTIDFIQRLLQKEPEKRLGSGTNGADKVMAHAFFSGINWNDMYLKRVTAPFIPTAANLSVVDNLDSQFTLLCRDMPAIINTTETLTPEEQEMFQGFEFSSE